jgi:hypothetical protein
MVMFPFKPPFTVDYVPLYIHHIPKNIYPYWDDVCHRQGTQTAFEDFARQPGNGYGLWNIPP